MKTFKLGQTTINLHENDISENVIPPNIISVDSETTGLSLIRDRLCLLQVAFSENECHFVKFDPGYLSKKIKPVNLVNLLSNENIKKVFHYGRFDLAMIKKFLGVEIKNMFCTKIASKLVRTYTDKHGLKELCKEMLNVDLNKSSQSSDWSVSELSKEQLKYASHDVIYLFRLKEKLEEMIAREDRQELLQKSFDFLPIRVKLDLAGWHDTDIFSH
tara:strand:+ start:23 stop:670 length:648 start_codon:yes stop_codon:yes gene_type:complete